MAEVEQEAPTTAAVLLVEEQTTPIAEAVPRSSSEEVAKPADDLTAEIRAEEEGEEEEENEEGSDDNVEKVEAKAEAEDKHEVLEELISFFDESHPPSNDVDKEPAHEVADNCVVAVDSPSPRPERSESPALEVTIDDSKVHFSDAEEGHGSHEKKKKLKKKKTKKLTKKVEEPSVHSTASRQDSPSKINRVIEVQDVARAKTSIARNRPSSRSGSPARPQREPEVNISTFFPYHTVLVADMYVRPVVVTILIPEKLKDMSPAKPRKKASNKAKKGGAESSEDEAAFADEDDSMDGEHDKEEKEKNLHDIKHLKQFVVKVNDVVTNKDALYVVVLKDFRHLLKDLIDEYDEPRVADYYKPTSLKWWAKYIKKLVLVFEKPNGQLSLLVDKKAVRRLIKKKMEHHHWMLASISVVESSVLKAQPSSATPSYVVVEEHATIDVTCYEVSNDEAAAVDEFSATYKSEYYGHNSVDVEESVDVVDDTVQEQQEPSDEMKDSQEAMVVEEAEVPAAEPYQEGYGDGTAEDPSFVDQSQYPQDQADYSYADGSAENQPPQYTEQTDSYYGEGQEGYNPEQSYEQSQPAAVQDYSVDEHGQYYAADGSQQAYNYDSSFENSYYPGSVDQSAIAPSHSFDSVCDNDQEVEYLFKDEGSLAHHSITLPSVAPEPKHTAEPKKKKGHKSKSVDMSSASSLPSISRGKSMQGDREVTPAMAKNNELLSKAYAPIYSMYTEEDVENVMKPVVKKNKKHRAKSMMDLPVIEQEPSLQLSDAPEAHMTEAGEMQKASSAPVILAPIIPNRSPSFASMRSADSRSSIHSRPLSPFDRDTQKLRGSEKLAADIIGKVRRRVFQNPKLAKRGISQTEAKLIASPFAKKLLIEKPNVEELLSNLSVKGGSSK